MSLVHATKLVSALASTLQLRNAPMSPKDQEGLSPGFRLVFRYSSNFSIKCQGIVTENDAVGLMGSLLLKFSFIQACSNEFATSTFAFSNNILSVELYCSLNLEWGIDLFVKSPYMAAPWLVQDR